jgi:hypothetical protein
VVFLNSALQEELVCSAPARNWNGRWAAFDNLWILGQKPTNEAVGSECCQSDGLILGRRPPEVSGQLERDVTTHVMLCFCRRAIKSDLVL